MPDSPLPLVTVITVCLNAAATVRRTLDSVAAQTYPHIEYIVIDGGSADGTVERIQACPAVTFWASEPDGGIAEAFNKGIALAGGEWVGIINADDWYEPETVARVVAAADGADVIHGAVRYWNEENPMEVYRPNQARLKKEMTVNHPSVFVRRSAYEAEGGFDPAYRFAMDYEMMVRLYVRGYRFKEIGGAVLANMRYGGVSDRRWVRAFREAARAKVRHLPFPAAAGAYCCWQLVRGGIRRLCERLGLTGVVRRVRGKWSPMRKEYEDPGNG